LNLKNGIKITPYVYSEESRRTDNELYILSRYLEYIAVTEDLSSIDHNSWRNFTMENLMPRNENNE